MCLVVSEKGVGRNREILDKTIAMLEKSGYFLKAPERCTPNKDDRHYDIQVHLKNEVKAGNMAVAVISGFICGATLTVIPAYARDEYVLTVELKRNDQPVKEYVYREHMNSWIHFSMLFMMPNHMPWTGVHVIYERMIMNFLHDYSRDVRQGMLIAIDQ